MGKQMLTIDNYTFSFHKKLADDVERWKCTIRSCKAYFKRTSIGDIFDEHTEHNHSRLDDSVIRKNAISNTLKRKARENLHDRPAKLIRSELKPEDVNILTQDDVCSVCGASAKIGGWDTSPNTQYHIQTDEGPERYFKYQTVSGQYRKEKRLQDGTVVGSYGWVDADGFLRLRDYIADSKGYRIVRTKMVRVGSDSSNFGPIVVPPQRPVTTSLPPISLSDYLKEKKQQESYGTTPKPITLSEYLKTPQVEINNNGYPSTTPAPSYSTTTAVPEYQSTPAPYYSSTTEPGYIPPVTYRPHWNLNSILYDKKAYDSVGAFKYEFSNSNNVPRYDGVSLTHNGFRYYLPRQYHEEENLPGDQKAGSFGYIDPFGIRRVVYYNSSPGSGFVHRKNNRYVGFGSTPYDPRD